jgi:hypothetical protein
MTVICYESDRIFISINVNVSKPGTTAAGNLIWIGGGRTGERVSNWSGCREF